MPARWGGDVDRGPTAAFSLRAGALRRAIIPLRAGIGLAERLLRRSARRAVHQIHVELLDVDILLGQPLAQFGEMIQQQSFRGRCFGLDVRFIAPFFTPISNLSTPNSGGLSFNRTLPSRLPIAANACSTRCTNCARAAYEPLSVAAAAEPASPADAAADDRAARFARHRRSPRPNRRFAWSSPRFSALRAPSA